MFCGIVKGNISCEKIWEDERVLVFLDINPYVLGHVLVVPKKHSRWLWDMGEEDYGYLMGKVRLVANVLREVFDTDWVEEIVAGIGAEHTHVHLLPRKVDDGLGEIPTRVLSPKPSDEKMREIGERIRDRFK